MNVLLVIPTYNYTFDYPTFVSIANFPVGFAYLAAALKQAGISVTGVNPNNRTGFSSAKEMVKSLITEALAGKKFDLIGLGGLCIDYPFLKDAIGFIREAAPGVPIVLGGGIVINDQEFAFSTLKPDFCIIGEAEEILVELVNTLQNGQMDFERIPNLGFWKNGAPVFTREDFSYIDLDRRPFPDYEPFDIDHMQHFSLASANLTRFPRRDPRLMILIAARNCPFSCTFCVHQKGFKYRYRSIDNIMQEIDFLYRRYRFNLLAILDELFAANKKRLQEFSEALLEARKTKGWDFHWTFQTHASASLDRETLALAKKAGCYFFSYGLESASPTVLASMRKRTKPSQFVEAIRIAQDVKIGFGGNFIFGDLAETPRTFRETMQFFRKHCLDIHVSPGYIQPYPGSQIFDVCMERGIITDKWKYYEEINQKAFQINMTGIPSPIWDLWLYGLKYLILIMPWVKAVPAASCQRVDGMKDHPAVLAMKAEVFDIAAVCPHCATKILIRETIGLKPPPPTTFKGRLKKVVRESKFVAFAFNQGTRFLSLWHRTKDLFSFFRFKNEGTLSSVVTGCPECAKRFRINLDHVLGDR
jgi:radical SAM superfamily enzyme YgiQ (UPF0313 family)